jgi:hypothetical protein
MIRDIFRTILNNAPRHRRDLEYEVDRGRESCQEGGLANRLVSRSTAFSEMRLFDMKLRRFDIKVALFSY